MLGDLNLDQILYVILAGVVGDGESSYNRAFLFLADEEGRELRTSVVVAPGKDAGKTEGRELDLSSLLDAHANANSDPRTQELAKSLTGFGMPLSASAPPIASDQTEDLPVQMLIAQCANARKPFRANKMRAIFQPPSASGLDVVHFSKIACVPLVVNELLAGVLLVDNLHSQRDIQEEELAELETLGNLAAIALAQAGLHRKLKDMEALDGLTGVFNRQHFEQRLEQETSRAKRAGRPLSSLLFDIDEFKACNQAHGHKCGDLVLKDIASFLKDRLRNEDLICRFAGQQFMVLLTGGATEQESMLIAEKFRDYVSQQSIGGLPVGEITVSAGIHVRATDKIDGGKILAHAEDALAQAQQAGRGQVALARDN